MKYVCPVFYPTLEDVAGPFEAYVEKLENKLCVTGICKIVAPAGWTPRRRGYPESLDLTIERPIRQHATGSRGLFRAIHIEQKQMSLRHDFRPLALDPDNNCTTTTDPHELERKYWKNVTLRPPLYGADVPGSLFDDKPAFKVGGWCWDCWQAGWRSPLTWNKMLSALCSSCSCILPLWMWPSISEFRNF